MTVGIAQRALVAVIVAREQIHRPHTHQGAYPFTIHNRDQVRVKIDRRWGIVPCAVTGSLSV